MVTCRICDMPIAETNTVKLGMGAFCRVNRENTKVARPDLCYRRLRACYDYEIVDGVVCIVDNNRSRSVTNDAAGVIRDLIADGVDLLILPVIYLDTFGSWDMMVVTNGYFAGFRSINKRDREAAIKELKSSSLGRTCMLYRSCDD